MDHWEFTKILVSYRFDKNIDFVISTGTEPPTDTNHETLKIRFNVSHDVCDTYMGGLISAGWEAVGVDTEENCDEVYLFKRKIK